MPTPLRDPHLLQIIAALSLTSATPEQQQQAASLLDTYASRIERLERIIEMIAAKLGETPESLVR